MHDTNVELLGSACEMLAGSILADAPIPEKLEPVPGRSDDTKIPWENMGRKMGTYEKIWKKKGRPPRMVCLLDLNPNYPKQITINLVNPVTNQLS